MKKILVLFALICCSQMEAQVQMKGGLKAGYASATIANMSADTRNGFYAGVYGDLTLGRFYSMQLEMLYLQQGVSDYYTYTYDEKVYEKIDIYRNYLSLNLINRLNFNRIGIFVGPGIDIKVSDNENKLHNLEYDSHNRYYDNNSDIDLTLNIGASFKINESLSIEARLRQGLIEQVISNNYQYSDGPNLNRSFLIGLNYTFK